MPRSSAVSRLAAIAEDQWGLITRRQAELAGIPRRTLDRLTAEGRSLERVAQGVYRLTGAPTPDHLELRAAWLQLAPDVPAWKRTPEQGVISHRSAASVYGLGNLPADRHEFTVPTRKQSRRKDVRLHHRRLEREEWGALRGLPVTRPARIASDLLFDHEDAGAVAQIVAEAMREIYDYPGTFADALAPHARKFGLRQGDGIALLRWFLELVGDPNTPRWLEEARAHVDSNHAKEAVPKGRSR